jgi:hypothetical protein
MAQDPQLLDKDDSGRYRLLVVLKKPMSLGGAMRPRGTVLGEIIPVQGVSRPEVEAALSIPNIGDLRLDDLTGDIDLEILGG